MTEYRGNESVRLDKAVRVDFLYLDTTICGRCQGTEKSLDDALSEVSEALRAEGYEVTVNKVNIATRDLAIRHRFVSSPTIRVNGKDIAVELKESLCEDCGALCGDNVDCRVWVYNGVEYTTPPKELIVEAILREAHAAAPKEEAEDGPFQLPENLERFFEAKARKKKLATWKNRILK
ncbi:MAG: DUF2703 domain-containing protein [Christensenellales bacterium]|jgi:hypothetical protein